MDGCVYAHSVRIFKHVGRTAALSIWRDDPQTPDNAAAAQEVTLGVGLALSDREATHRTGPMDSLLFTTQDQHIGQGTIADVAKVEDRVARLFERFRLDLEEMLGRSAQTRSSAVAKSHLREMVAHQ